MSTDKLKERLCTSRSTGLAYSSEMAGHFNIWCKDYLECPLRATKTYERCLQEGLLDRCTTIQLKEAGIENVELIHDLVYIEQISDTESMSEDQLANYSSQFHYVFFNNLTWHAAMLSVDAVLQLTEKVVKNELLNGMAIIRPPGHHAMEAEACGYCVYNNVAIAAKYAQEKLGLKRILIVDWDVHHGQGTQYAFYHDPNVLFFSIHRYEHGHFWPCLRESDYDFIGVDKGQYYNINVPLNETELGNADYLAIFHNILLPVAHEFNPQLVLVSAGYDAALGCPEGLMNVHPACFGYMTHKLMDLACGKVVICLEGGYCIDSLAESCMYTLKALLRDPLPLLEKLEEPTEGIKKVILDCITILRTHWRSLCLQGYSEVQPLPILDANSQISSWQDVKVLGFCDEVETKPLPTDHWKCVKLKELLANTRIPTYEKRTCIAYSSKMMKHFNLDPAHRNHPERPERLQRIHDELLTNGLLLQCHQVESRPATKEEIMLVHEEEHFNQMQASAYLCEDELLGLSRTYNSVFLNKDTFDCALLATGSLLSVLDEVCTGKCRNGMAVVRPPGHHAEPHKCMGFSIFNSVAIAAQYAQSKHGLTRVLIVDWDVHFGNGTSRVFLANPNVLYISLHRYDDGLFYPMGGEGSHENCGVDQGLGYNVNVAWNGRKNIGNTEYLSAFHHVVLPIAHEFNPQLVLVSAGFDAAQGDSLGRLNVSPECFGLMTQMLSCLAEGRVVLALEGGYNLLAISQCTAHCVASLLGYPAPKMKINHPCDIATLAIRNTVRMHSPYWNNLKFFANLPRYCRMTTRTTTSEHGDTVILPDSAATVAVSDLSSRLSYMSVEDTNDSVGGPPHLEPEDKPLMIEDENVTTMELAQGCSHALRAYFAVEPRTDCPHVDSLPSWDAVAEKFDPLLLNPHALCEKCADNRENWICLHCAQILCGRQRNEHMLFHHMSLPQHTHALSWVDLSVWCYLCDAYVVHPHFQPHYRAAYLSKFGEEPVNMRLHDT